MDKKQAQQLTQQLFTQSFELESYRNFLRNLLNQFEPRDGHYTGNYIPDAFKLHVNQYWRIGKYVDPDGNELDLLVVEVKSLTKLERARSALRNFAVNRLKQFEKEASLIAFYAQDDGGADWRFSFVKIEHEAYKDDKGKVKLKQELTPAKRHSYLVGVHENSHTACKQLLPVLTMDYADPRIEEIEAAFSIEKVTDEFFDQYKALFQKLGEQLKRQHFFNCASEEETDQGVSRFAKKLLGQIVFLYFLQKKGWLGAAQGQSWGEGSRRFMRERYEQIAKAGGSYYHDFLQYLFYEALACERKGQDDSGYYQRFSCRIPFLNGGLFEADYDWQNETIDLPNSLFHNDEKTKAGDLGTGILDVFDRYNFTIKEDEPLDKEVAVDPEMLGKVFENMLEVTERKNKGAFYTPREIVHYMCQESLIHYLDNRLNNYAETFQPIDSDQPLFFGGLTDKKGQPKLEIVHQEGIRVPKDELETLIRKGHLALENDTRVLSKGKETETYRFQLPEAVRNYAKEIDTALADIKVCDPAIGSGAFPVGLLHEIVNARLALAPHSGNDKSAYDLKRHAIAESIYGVDIDASAIDIARLRLWLSLIVDEEDFGTIEALPNLDYKIVRGDSLLGIDDVGKVDDIFNPKFSLIGELEKEKQKFFSTTDHDLKIELSNKINDLINKVTDGKENFDFKIYFSEVWHSKGGFDVVIGNPPYGVKFESKLKKELCSRYVQAKKIPDSYAFFIVKGTSLLKKTGNLLYITPNTFCDLENGDEFRRYLLTKYAIELIWQSGWAFSSAVVDTVVMMLSNKLPKSNHKIIINTNQKISNILQKSVLKNPLVKIDFRTDGDLVALRNKIFENSSPLCEKFYVKAGVKMYELGKGTPPQTKEIVSTKPFSSKNVFSSESRVLFRGSDISQYKLTDSGERVNYGPWLAAPRSSELFNSPKILMRRTDDKLMSCLELTDAVCVNSCHVIKSIKENTPIRYYSSIMSILNSSVCQFVFEVDNPQMVGKTFAEIKVVYVERLPIPELNDFIEDKLHCFSQYVLFLQDDCPGKKRPTSLVYVFFKDLIDGIVYELYFPDEIKAAGKEILPHLGDLPPITDTMSEEEKLAIIQREFDRLYDPRHPVRNHLETLDSVEVVRTIREALKR